MFFAVMILMMVEIHHVEDMTSKYIMAQAFCEQMQSVKELGVWIKSPYTLNKNKCFARDS